MTRTQAAQTVEGPEDRSWALIGLLVAGMAGLGVGYGLALCTGVAAAVCSLALRVLG